MNHPPSITIPRPHANGPLFGEAVLHVCTMISNPVRYQSRYRLYELFSNQIQPATVEHWTVEVAYGNRSFAITDPSSDHHLRLRSKHELWHKENALNLLRQYILAHRPEAEYFAWVDADVTFARADWAYETLHQLQHYDVVQMFGHSQDCGPKYEPVGNRQVGLMYAYCNDLPNQGKEQKSLYLPNGYGHPGYAWAARRSALDALGGLLDTCVLGSADHHMAMGLIGKVEKTIHDKLGPRLKQVIRAWGDNAIAELRANVGYVDGLLLHHWHGRKADRRYTQRWNILVDNAYDPDVDLRVDSQGLYQLTSRSMKLRDDIRSYFRARNEDSIEPA